MNRQHTHRQQQWYIARSILLCLILLVAGFFGGMMVQRLRADNSTSTFADLDAVYKVIEENYYYLPTDEAGQEQMTSDMESGAIDGALETLDDAYTRYLDVDESQTSQESLQGTYGGIGVDIVLDGDVAFVSAVVPESPADKAGIQRGDVIEQVDGARVQTTDIDEATQLLRGEIGDPVTITTIRPTTGEAQTLELTFEEIVVPQVTLAFVEGTSYAWLRITLFGDATVPDLDNAIAEIRAHGSTGIILDLRGNGGGWVDAARATLGRFLDPSVGPAMYEDQSSADGDLIAMPIETGDSVEILDLPMVVLIDGGTASAAEIVAGALKDYGRATVIGQNSFGKGSVQRIYEFSDGSTMRVTVAEWFTPSKSRIQSEGIRPDIEVDAGGDTDASDPMLEAAIIHLDARLAPAATPAASPAANVNKITPGI
ncbi:MAG: S41 family peptidase [Thermomicrobiales bacterium]|nr:S41 family peptidase [Thermomicrobiales bacterium]